MEPRKLCSFASRFAAAVALSTSLAGATTLQLSAPYDGTVSPSTAGDVLYTQLDDPSGHVFTDQQFEPYYHWYDNEAADDFVVESPMGWDISELYTVGLLKFPDSEIPLQWVNVFFYHDAPVPTQHVLDCGFPTNTSVVNDEGSLTIDVDCTLAPGRYWFSHQVRMDSGGIYQQHYWATRTAARNLPAVWRNPLNEFGTGCTDWSPANAVCGMPGQDFLFEVRGSEHVPGSVPAVGPLGALVTILCLAAGSLYVRRRRR